MFLLSYYNIFIDASNNKLFLDLDTQMIGYKDHTIVTSMNPLIAIAKNET